MLGLQEDGVSSDEKKESEEKLDDSQNPIKTAHMINKPKLNYHARQEIKAQLLFKTMKA